MTTTAPSIKALFLLAAFLLVGFLNALRSQSLESYKHHSDTHISSSHLGYDRELSIYVPSSYQDSIDFQFPLIVVFDRHLERMQGYALHTMDYLTSTLAMPPAIIVQVESGEGINRRHETNLKASSADALGAENEAFVFEELLPFAKNRLKASDFTVLIGHSRYGYFTSYLLSRRMQEVQGVISMSPFFTQKNVDLVDSLVVASQETTLPHHTYYRFAIGNDYPEDYALIDSAVTHGLLQNEMLDIKGELYTEAFHNATPGLLIAEGLYDIFEFWAHSQNAWFPYGKTDISILPELQNGIAQHYGEGLPFAMSALNGKGWEFFGEEKYSKAIQCWELALEQYPNLAEFHLYIAAAQLELKLDYEQTIETFLNAIGASEVYSEQDILELMEEVDLLMKASGDSPKE